MEMHDFEYLWPGFLVLSVILFVYALALSISVADDFVNTSGKKIKGRIVIVTFLVIVGTISVMCTARGCMARADRAREAMYERIYRD